MYRQYCKMKNGPDIIVRIVLAHYSENNHVNKKYELNMEMVQYLFEL